MPRPKATVKTGIKTTGSVKSHIFLLHYFFKVLKFSSSASIISLINHNADDGDKCYGGKIVDEPENVRHVLPLPRYYYVLADSTLHKGFLMTAYGICITR
jgi:hypothetical protein